MNNEVVSKENSKVLEKNEDKYIVKNYQDKRKEYTRKNYKTSNNLIPYWMEHPEVCKSEKASPEEQAYMEDLLKEFKEDWYMIKIGGYSL